MVPGARTTHRELRKTTARKGPGASAQPLIFVTPAEAKRRAGAAGADSELKIVSEPAGPAPDRPCRPSGPTELGTPIGRARRGSSLADAEVRAARSGPCSPSCGSPRPSSRGTRTATRLAAP